MEHCTHQTISRVADGQVGKRAIYKFWALILSGGAFYLRPRLVRPMSMFRPRKS
jgi:hypothetical protein